MRGAKIRSRLPLLLVLALALGACGDGADPTTTTAEPAAETTTTEPGLVVDSPVHIGFASATQPSYGPALLAIETAERVPMEATFFQDSELSLQGLLQGEVDMLAIGVNGPMIITSEGGELVIIGVTIGNDWTLVTTRDIETPADLAGRTLAVHSETSTGTPLVRGTLDEAGVEADFVIIAGSPNRAQAMAEGQIDATTLFLSSSIELELLDPDRFRTLLDYGDVPFASQAIVTTRSWLAENQDIAQALMEHFIETGRRISSDQAWATELLVGMFPDDDPSYLERLVQEYAGRGLWVTDGGDALLANFEEAIRINIDLGTLAPDAPADASHYVDRTVLDAALAALGG